MSPCQSHAKVSVSHSKTGNRQCQVGREFPSVIDQNHCYHTTVGDIGHHFIGNLHAFLIYYIDFVFIGLCTCHGCNEKVALFMWNVNLLENSARYMGKPYSIKKDENKCKSVVGST